MNPTRWQTFRHSIAIALLLLVATASTPLCHGQIIFPPQVGGFGPATNALAPIPPAGLLVVDYNFYTLPDTMDVYYGTAHIFNSGPIAGSGQFSIAYGPGAASSLTIIMNQDAGLVGSVWDYSPLIVVPEPGSLPLVGMGLITWAVWRRRTKRLRG